VVEGIGTMASR